MARFSAGGSPRLFHRTTHRPYHHSSLFAGRVLKKLWIARIESVAFWRHNSAHSTSIPVDGEALPTWDDASGRPFSARSRNGRRNRMMRRLQ
jgi:hypothetical protein